jgi:hypothetical protein
LPAPSGARPHWEGESRTAPNDARREEVGRRYSAGKLPNRGDGAKNGGKENAEQRNTRRTLNRGKVLQSLGGIRQAAMRDKRIVFTTLLHHVTPEPSD